MKEVTKYEACDGEVFDSQEDAISHENLLNLEEWYEGNRIYGSFEGCVIEWGNLLSGQGKIKPN